MAFKLSQLVIKSKSFNFPLKLQTLYRSCSRAIDDESCIISSPSPIHVDAVVGVTVPEFLWSNLPKYENLIAFECGVSKRKYTYGEIYKKSRSFGVALKQSGLKEKDVLAIIMPNIPEYPIVGLGLWEVGLVACLFNPIYTPDEVARQLVNCEAKAVVTINQYVPQIKLALQKCPTLGKIFIICIGNETPEGCHSFYDMIKVSSQGVEFMTGSKINTLEEIAVLPYSSGTTGPPKGVQLTISNICSNLLQILQPGFMATHFFQPGVNEQERFIAVLPFFHIYGFALIMSKSIYLGGHTMTFPLFQPDTYIDGLRRHRPTFLHVVPPMIGFLVNCPNVIKSDFDSIQAVFSGAAPAGQVLANKLIKKSEKYFFFQEGYGMTELSPVSHITPQSTKNTKIGSCGRPVPGTICKVVCTETGIALPVKKEGEICVKGPQVMKGYFKNEKATKEMIDADGWLHTGDIGYYDNEQFFWIVDRSKELIKVRGYQVAPSELEDVLRTHPDVADVAVIGIPDERAGELPRAYIIPSNENITEAKIHEFLSEKVASYKQLKGGVEFVKVIPKSQSGKILRRELKQSYLSKNK